MKSSYNEDDYDDEDEDDDTPVRGAMYRLIWLAMFAVDRKSVV